jgi:hypothetical protein
MPRSLPLLALVALAASAHAQGIATDRPDFTESTEAVPLSRVQAEAGATWERAGEADALSGPELLVRWAPLEWLELRFGAPGYVEAEGTSGFTDPTLGLKVPLGPVGGWGLAAIATVLVPIGDSTLSPGGLDPALVLTASRDLSPTLSLGTQAGATWDTAADRLDLAATLVVGTELTERLGTFLELAAGALQDEPALLLHHGYTYGLGPDVQVDVHAAVGLTAGAPDFLLGAGVAFRR